tara:strand:+ start:120 stop:281 length:162 start_codon:yes stop_codon:yes gene_type:complete
MNSLEYPITGSNKNQRLNEKESRSEDIEDEEKGCQLGFDTRLITPYPVCAKIG